MSLVRKKIHVHTDEDGEETVIPDSKDLAVGILDLEERLRLTKGNLARHIEHLEKAGATPAEDGQYLSLQTAVNILTDELTLRREAEAKWSKLRDKATAEEYELDLPSYADLLNYQEAHREIDPVTGEARIDDLALMRQVLEERVRLREGQPPPDPARGRILWSRFRRSLYPDERLLPFA